MKTLRSGVFKFWFHKLELGCLLVFEKEREDRERYTYTDAHRQTDTHPHIYTQQVL